MQPICAVFIEECRVIVLDSVEIFKGYIFIIVKHIEIVIGILLLNAFGGNGVLNSLNILSLHMKNGVIFGVDNLIVLKNGSH